MADKSSQLYKQDVQDTSSAHIANEAQRDTFISLGHTALFASSIAFIGNVVGGQGPTAIGWLYAGWTSSFLGLLALTLSFESASRYNDAHRGSAGKAEEASRNWVDNINKLALFTFPLSLACFAIFAALNISSIKERKMSNCSQGEDITRGVTAPRRAPPPPPVRTPTPIPPKSPPPPSQRT